MGMLGAATAASVPPTLQPTQAAAQQMPYSFCMPEAGMQFPPYEAPVHLYPGTFQAASSFHVLQAPQQPELRIAGSGTGVSVYWSGIGPAAISYVVELRESVSAASNRFVRMAPAEALASLELCIQGLVPGRSYTVCVRGVGKDGIEGPPSVTPRLAMPSDALLQKTPDLPLQTTEKQSGLEVTPRTGMQPTVAELAPEVTGHEVLFLD